MKIYYFGGGDGVQALNDVYVLDPGTLILAQLALLNGLQSFCLGRT